MCTNAWGVLDYFLNFPTDNVRTFLKWASNIKIYCPNEEAGGRTGVGSCSELHGERQRISIFHSLCQQRLPPPTCFTAAGGGILTWPSQTGLVPCSRAKVPAMLLFRKRFVNLFFLGGGDRGHCSEIQMESPTFTIQGYNEACAALPKSPAENAVS